MGKLIVPVKPISHQNVLRLLIANKPLEEYQIILANQKLQHDKGFPLYHVYKNMGYLRSLTIEEDIEVLRSDGQIIEKDGLYKLTKKGIDEIIPLNEDYEEFSKELSNVIKEVQGLSNSEAKTFCEKYYQKFKPALQNWN